MPDAVVIGAGPNGLVAANLLADAGWSVEVLEAQSRPGGAVKSSEPVEPGFVSDEMSAFYFVDPVTLLWATFLALAGLQNRLSKRKWDDMG